MIHLCFIDQGVATLAGSLESWSNGFMDNNEDKARQILRRVERESDGAQFGGKGLDDSDDPVEIWGTRIGRGLGLLIMIFLLLAFIVWFGAALQ